jgi:hypothetical protein
MSDKRKTAAWLAAIVALGVSAAPVASAGLLSKQAAVLYNGHAGLGANAKA